MRSGNEDRGLVMCHGLVGLLHTGMQNKSFDQMISPVCAFKDAPRHSKYRFT